jgi:hypothetical protein
MKITPVSRVPIEKLIIFQLVKKCPPFMDPEGSLLCSQGPASGPYLEPDEFSPHPPTILPSDLF